MDLTPLVHNETLDIVDYTVSFIDKLKEDVSQRLNKLR